MAVTQIGIKAQFGIVKSEPLRFEGFPSGAHIRFRQWPDEFARAFVRYTNPETGLAIIEVWYVSNDNGVIRPALLKETNHRTMTYADIAPLPKRRARYRLIEDPFASSCKAISTP